MRIALVAALLALAACVIAIPISELMAEKIHPVPYERRERSSSNADRIQAHIIAHTHDDVGWLKTEDEYFYGANNTIQRAGVQYILDSVIRELSRNPSRKFMYVEIGFFWRWWNAQDDEIKTEVRRLVKAGQLEFVNAGWVMHDEAATHYIEMIDQMTLGHMFVLREFGVVPSAYWHIDPFGHSSGNAYMFADMGAESFFFARADYEDIVKRRNNSDMEMIWQADPSTGAASDLFTNIMYEGTYCSCYGTHGSIGWDDQNRQAMPVEDQPQLYNFSPSNLAFVASQMAEVAKTFATGYKTNHVLIPFGGDFQFMNANINYKNMDKVLAYVAQHPELGIDAFYSTPSAYTKAVHDSKPNLGVKTDDFMPYRDGPHAEWTGYFTSRAVFKGMTRVTNAVLQATEKLATLAAPQTNQYLAPASLEFMRQSQATAQHHDAVTGTEKTHVAEDYGARLALGVELVRDVVQDALQKLMGAKPTQTSAFAVPLRNSTDNVFAATAAGAPLSFVVINPMAWQRTEVITLNVSTPHYQVTSGSAAVASQVNAGCPMGTSPGFLLSFVVQVPPLGVTAYSLTPAARNDVTQWNKLTESGVILQSTAVAAAFCGCGALMNVTDLSDGSVHEARHMIGWYMSSEGTPDDGQRSGAYIFRPNVTFSNGSAFNLKIGENHASFYNDGPILKSLHTKYLGTEMEISIRYNVPVTSDAVEIMHHVTHINNTLSFPIQNGSTAGKEVISRIITDLDTQGAMYTDTNGVHTLKRIRNHRDTWTLNSSEPISDNYYPINARAYLHGSTGASLGIATDRSHGGASLVDGQIEIMVQRALTQDDKRGVGEPLNEQYWLGDLSARFHVTLGAKNAVLQRTKTHHMQLSYPLLSFIGVDVPPAAGPLAPMISGLPDNVELLSLNTQYEQGYTLLRLRHIYEAGEHPTLSQPAQVDLAALFKGIAVSSVQETTLTGNAILAHTSRMRWTSQPVPDLKQLDGTVVTLQPNTFRTFRVNLKTA